MHSPYPLFPIKGFIQRPNNPSSDGQSLILTRNSYNSCINNLSTTQSDSNEKGIIAKRPPPCQIILETQKRLKAEQGSIPVREVKFEISEDDEKASLKSSKLPTNVQSSDDTSPENGNLTLEEGLRILRSQQLASQFIQQQFAQQAYRRRMEQMEKQRYFQQQLAQRMQQEGLGSDFQQKFVEQMRKMCQHQQQSNQAPMKNGIQQFPSNSNFKNSLEMMQHLQFTALLSQERASFGHNQLSQDRISQKFEENNLQGIKQESIKIECHDFTVEEDMSATDRIFCADQIAKKAAGVSSSVKKLKKQRGEDSLKNNLVVNKTKKQKTKKKKKKISHHIDYLTEALTVQMLQAAEKFRLRRKNKWQQIAEGEIDPTQPESFNNVHSEMNPLKDMNKGSSISTTGKGRTKNLETSKKPTFAQQSLENEKNKDFEYLLSLTIMKNPERTIYNQADDEFVVKSMYDRDPITKVKGDMRSKTINISSESQAVIPNLLEKKNIGESLRKIREPVWSPNATSVEEVEAYLGDLNGLFNCADINQERALKLLKRKEYKREKVRINISKNGRFYSSFLVLPESCKINHNC